MTFEPVIPAVILVAVAVVLIAIRLVALRRALRPTAAGRRARVVLRWSGLTAAVLLVLLAAARPSIQSAGPSSGPAATAAGSNVNVFFVVDRSVDLRVQDFGDHKSRMAGIRSDITALIDQYPRARFAVISFSSRSATDWPLSDDIWSLRPMIAGLSPYTSMQPDSMYQVDAAAASDTLRYKLYQAEHQYPRSANLVFYVGAGAPGSRAPQGKFDLGSAKVAGGAVLGYGTSAGGPIPREIINGDVVYAADAQTGTALNSAINEQALRAIAGQLGVGYVHREGGQGIASVVSAVNAESNGAATTLGVERTELYWVLTLPAAVLVLIEICLTIRHFRRNRLARRDVEL